MKKYVVILIALCSFVIPGLTPTLQAAEQKSQEEANFLSSMSMHHKDGIEMAKMAIDKSQSKEVKSLAQKISSEQTDELKKMQSLQSKWYPKTDVKVESQKMDMSKLAQSKGKEFDLAFLDMMCEHHKQAIDMAKSAMGDLVHKETKSMAEKTLKKQTAEIEKMEKLKTSIQ